MTQALYMDDSYIKEFEAKITKIDGNKVYLDKTAFYPRGGGLVSDTGKLIRDSKEYKVVFVGKESGEIYHEVENVEGLSEGDVVKGIIDWERRYRVMRMHTASHIISALLYKARNCLITGNQISYDKSRIDFNLETMDKEFLQDIIEKANKVVEMGIDVKVYYLPKEEAFKIPGIVKLAGKLPPNVEKLRIVEIENIDIQADGGVHVKNTKEIGKIVLLKTENKGKNNRRLYFTVEP